MIPRKFMSKLRIEILIEKIEEIKKLLDKTEN